MNENVKTCYYCGQVIEDVTTASILNGEWYCEDCSDEHIGVCDHCGEHHELDEMIYFNDELLCDDCYENLTIECDHCGERVWRDDTYSDDYITICSYCRDHDFYRCEDCDSLVHYNNVFQYDGSYYCQDCYDNIKENEAIHDYYHKPIPTFYGDSKLYMGIELEIDGAGEDHDNAQTILAIDGQDRIYCKHDGSLEEGFEIVSHPCDYDYHINEMKWGQIMTQALSMGYTSHNGGTCGLHIHINRDFFGSDCNSQEYHIQKVVYFVEKHWDKILKLSRRTKAQMDRWASRYGVEATCDETYKKAKGCFDRYHALNLQNNATIEFRMFRGTLKYSTFVATLQLVKNICEYCCKKSVCDLEKSNWNDFINYINKVTYKELVEYMNARNVFNEEV